ncbi:MAG TPA: DUF2141 domain-containing protein [Sphingomonas sp.]|jgi:uncharacterized protein (DUF2141 family)
MALALAAFAVPTMAQPVGADAAACSDAQASAVLVQVGGLRNGQGTVRVQAYGPDPATFLAKGRWVRRVEVPLNGRRAVDVCLRLPATGRYAVAVRHDANASGKSDWSDGGGFSRNPKLSLLRLKPKFEQSAIAVGRGVTRVGVVMNYRHGLSIGPERAN